MRMNACNRRYGLITMRDSVKICKHRTARALTILLTTIFPWVTLQTRVIILCESSALSSSSRHLCRWVQRRPDAAHSLNSGNGILNGSSNGAVIQSIDKNTLSSTHQHFMPSPKSLSIRVPISGPALYPCTSILNCGPSSPFLSALNTGQTLPCKAPPASSISHWAPMPFLTYF